MSIEEYAEKIKIIEDKLIRYITSEEHVEENFDNLIQIMNDNKILSDKYSLKIYLYLINRIANNHHRYHHFFNKIEKILKNAEKEIKKKFTNKEIFKIFQKNKRILLFLIEEQIIIFDEYIYNEIMDMKYQMIHYPEYFSIEIKPFIEEEVKKIEAKKKDNQQSYFLYHDLSLFPIYERMQKHLKDEKFNEKRKNGENDGYLNEIIRKDSIEEFITFVLKENYSLNNYIELSIFETNNFLFKSICISLIEYAAFHGSVQVFKYLYKNGVKMTPKLWLYAIHGCDEEIIHILEENQIEIKKEIQNINNINYDDFITYEMCLKESLKCHHNDITNYLLQNYDDVDLNQYVFKYLNFEFLTQKNEINEYLFYACKYDYFGIVDYLFNTNKVIFDKDFKFVKIAASKNNDEILRFLLLKLGNSIKDSCFRGCINLRSFSIPSFIQSIGNYSFCECTELMQIVIPSSLKSIGEYSFYECQKLKEVVIPSSVNSIGKGAFKNCSFLMKIVIPSSINSICDETFYGCISLKEFKIPSSITFIGNEAFRGCSSLMKIEIPSSVNSIGDNAFSECDSLAQITIPSSLTNIGKNAFPTN